MVDKKVKLITEPDDNQDLFNTTPIEVQSTHTDELVIVLCGPIGTPLHMVAKIIKDIFDAQYLYKCTVLQLSDIIEEFNGDADKNSSYNRKKDLIDKGNELREKFGCSVLADIAISKIAASREEDKKASGKEKFETRRICHIIDSIKNQEELEALKLVYRDMLYFIGVFSPMPLREKALKAKMSLPEVSQLIDRDSGEELEHGQTVRDTFPHADFFLRVDSDSEKSIKTKLERFLNIIFETEVITPTVAETAMYNAASAAGNSGCLSRQVGASVTDSDGNILSIGWNDVPKAQGGLYQYTPKHEDDYRCMNKGEGYCSNDLEKNLIAKEIAEKLIASGVVKPEQLEKASSIIREAKIKSLIEFSRSVHAEMHAIIQACQVAGTKVKGGKLFCTTYPCHSCARHIILSGIKEVYYIEPYRKSLATKLHDDAITEVESETSKVRILPFDGVAPERYLELFRMRKDFRKDDKTGLKIKRNKKDTSPKCEVTLESLPALEAIVVQRLVKNKIIDLGVQNEK